MGNGNSKYISELSDDSSESESDYSPESRPKNSVAISSRQVLSPTLQEERVENIGKDVSNMYLDQAAGTSSSSTSKELTVDSMPKIISNPKPEMVLTLDKVLEIENDLDQYEIVSLVYLLFDNAFFALQELLLFLKGAKKQLLYDWAIIQHGMGVQWERQLIEALCIIKNYKVLRELGYKKEDLIADFLPHVISCDSSINKLKKAVYLVCEKLDSERTLQFLQHANKFFLEQKIDPGLYDPLYLELYFLKWETMKLISPTDMGNVKRILKIMDEEVLYDILAKVLPLDIPRQEPLFLPMHGYTALSQSRKRSTSIDTHHRPPKSALEPFQSFAPTSPQSINQENFSFSRSSTPLFLGQDNILNNNRYKIDPENPGVLLIINQETFYTEYDEAYKHLLPDVKEKLENREGSTRDREYMKTVFKKFGFKVITADSLPHNDMVDKIKSVVRSVTKESSLFVCIMSHGETGIVYGANSCKVEVKTIQAIMCGENKENLAEKPKVLILQSCQGKECFREYKIVEEEAEDIQSVTTDGPKSTARTIDLLTFWATVEGYAAIRNKRTGSWFIQALCEKLEKLGNEHHLADLCTMILNDVASKRWIIEETIGENVMTPKVESTFRKLFYLPVIKSE